MSNDKAKWESTHEERNNDTDMMDEDDPMVEDNTEEDEDDYEAAERIAAERFGFSDNQRRMAMLRSGRNDPYRYAYTDVLDEKGEPLTAAPPEKVVHQKFFNDFGDDFDDQDLA